MGFLMNANNSENYLKKEILQMLKGLLLIAFILHHLAETTATNIPIHFFIHLGAPIASIFFFILGYDILRDFLNIRNGNVNIGAVPKYPNYFYAAFSSSAFSR